MTHNQAEELANVLKHLQGNEELQEVLVCAEAVVTTTINGREERITTGLPQGWCKEDLVEFYAGINRPKVTLRKCTVWLSTSNNTAWLQYDCEYPTDHPVWGYHEDQPGARRPQIPKSLEQGTIRWIDLDSPFSFIWAAIPETYMYIAADRPLNELGEHPLTSDLSICTVFAYEKEPRAGINHWFTDPPSWIKLGTMPSADLPGPWNVCIAKRPKK